VETVLRHRPPGPESFVGIVQNGADPFPLLLRSAPHPTSAPPWDPSKRAPAGAGRRSLGQAPSKIAEGPSLGRSRAGGPPFFTNQHNRPASAVWKRPMLGAHTRLDPPFRKSTDSAAAGPGPAGGCPRCWRLRFRSGTKAERNRAATSSSQAAISSFHHASSPLGPNKLDSAPTGTRPAGQLRRRHWRRIPVWSAVM